MATEVVVTNTGPLIALGRIDAFSINEQLPLRFVTPAEVADELGAGARLGHPVKLPTWVEVVPLARPLSQISVQALDVGEAAVIQLATELDANVVCIDEWRGRRAAAAVGLRVTGSLGLLGRAKALSIIGSVRPLVDKLAGCGVHYHPDLLSALGHDKVAAQRVFGTVASSAQRLRPAIKTNPGWCQTSGLLVPHATWILARQTQ